MEKQVDKNHYEFLSYVDKGRWNSYYHQVEEVIKSNPESVLIVGIGDNIVIEVLKKALLNSTIDTIDIDGELNPTYLGSITELSKVLNYKKYDTILCSQVLEHIPFDLLEQCIIELSKSVNKKLILSLPYANFKFGLSIRMPKINIKVASYIDRFYKKHKFDGEHYWELGTKQTKFKMVKSILIKYFDIEKNFVVDENAYHKFIILDKK